MLPKKGKMLPAQNHQKHDQPNYGEMIASALRAELGDTHRATKTIMHWSGASESAVKQWLHAQHGPCGEHLIDLMRESDAVLEAVLLAANRRDAIVTKRAWAAYSAITEMMRADELDGFGQTDFGRGRASRRTNSAPKGANDRVSDLENDPVNDRVKSPQHAGFNPRQSWFLEALGSGDNVGALDLARRCGVSEKTARRDLAALKARGLIEFVGPCRTGKYRLRPRRDNSDTE